jgi:RNA polymerase sigma factor (sigma-70 family)
VVLASLGVVSRPVRRAQDDVADADLLARLRAGERDAVDGLYDRYARPAYALARRILLDDVLAEDVVQEVFLSVWRNPAGFDATRASLSSWLLAMVHHKAVDAVRREEAHRRRRDRVEEDLAAGEPAAVRDVGEQAEDRVEAQRVRGALRDLPPVQREALALAYYGGYTQREVAALTGVPLGTVKTRMLSGMRKLRAALSGDVAEDGTTR